MTNWKERAYALFFIEKQPIIHIAQVLHKDKKTIRAYLKTCAGFDVEKQLRKENTLQKKRAYKSDWEKKKRNKKAFTGSYGENEDFILKNTHNIDVMVLSHERIEGR